MRKDLIHAARGLWQSPVYALTAILTIALGIGASTAIFSVVNAVLLRPLPYHDPDRLTLVWSELKARHLPDFPRGGRSPGGPWRAEVRVASLYLSSG